MEEKKRPVVVGLGEVLWDLLPEGMQLGGAPANFAYHARALGAAGFVVSAVGDDELGRQILERLSAQGLDVSHVAVDAQHPTGTVSVELDADGKPNYTIHENVAWDFLPSSLHLLELAPRADAVCFGSLAQRSEVSRATIQGFLKATHSHCLRVLDINLRKQYYTSIVLTESLRICNTLKLNDDELPIVSKLLSMHGPESEVMDALIRGFGLRAVALTRGARGAIFATPDGCVEHPGFPPPRIADTVGAGDAFTAAMVLGLLAERSPQDIVEHANRLASYVCSQNGAMPPVPPQLLPGGNREHRDRT